MCACELLFASKNMYLYKHSVFFAATFLSRCFVECWYKGWQISIGNDDILGDDYEVGEAGIFFGNNCLKHLCRRYFGDRCPLLPSYNLSNLTVKKCNLHFLMSNQACFFLKTMCILIRIWWSHKQIHMDGFPPIHKLKFPKLFIQSCDNGIFHFKRDPI